MIGTNKTDSAETVAVILDDFGAGRLPDPAHDLGHVDELVKTRRPDAVDKHGWKRIDQAERARGREAGRPRPNLVRVAQLVAASRPPS
jgi:ferredoxin--NADP+ reductase